MKRLAWMLIATGVIGWLLVHSGEALAEGGDAATTAARQEAALIQASTNAAHARVNSYLVHDYNVIDQDFLAPSALANVGETVGSALGVSHGSAITRNVDGERFYELTGEGEDGLHVSIYCTSFAASGGTPGSTVVVVRATRQTQTLTDLGDAMAAVARAIEPLHVQPQVSAYVDAAVPGLLSADEAQGLVQQVLAKTDATRVEGISSDGVTSVSADVPTVAPYLLTNGKRMNLQIAVHDDTVNGETDVVVGSPIIVDPY
ncbi:YwmB family TATA-box binding protein [Alicyclobacillus cycloheptanicus]|uniref:TATA-box binding n=1 Tax=Alicyclobacillus cycloheptanicus TaxID=1457 RepID=A0ABT9XKG0_9BACL|nr:YwmB family TATA-box binding protein [Alicyclobacillus cycloheptanicus]MDQ0190796.1 hypothetical protein [Alicyclobacillus cycloheptanicus]WDM02722.1 YwmB family TATA-box binding protein [Alicyclobacillus cycloheptanicus]